MGTPLVPGTTPEQMRKAALVRWSKHRPFVACPVCGKEHRCVALRPSESEDAENMVLGFVSEYAQIIRSLILK